MTVDERTRRGDTGGKQAGRALARLLVLAALVCGLALAAAGGLGQSLTNPVSGRLLAPTGDPLARQTITLFAADPGVGDETGVGVPGYALRVVTPRWRLAL